jgi:hypothetical protein
MAPTLPTSPRRIRVKQFYYREGSRYRRCPERSGPSMTGVLKVLVALALIMALASLLH